jgi:hypothetical protein
MSASPVLALGVALFLAACGGGDGPTGLDGSGNDNGRPDGGGNTSNVKDDPSFQNDIFPVFTQTGCTASGCHGSGQGDLTMTTASVAYGNLVDVSSPTSGEVRVIPGNAAGSYLVKKLEGTAAFGARMPLGGSPLSANDLQNIKNWINKGAKDN